MGLKASDFTYCKSFWHKYSSFLQIQTYLPYNPTILLPNIHPQEMKTVFIQKPAQKCLYWLYSLMLEAGNNRTVLQQQTTVVHLQWNTKFSNKKVMNY